MDQRDDEIDRRLASIEIRLAELGDALIESMLIQAEFMTWAADNTKLPVPKHAAQAVGFSQQMLDEVRSLVDANRVFKSILMARHVKGSAP